MLEVFTIDDAAVYRDRDLMMGLGVSPSAIDGARKRGELRSRKIGCKTVYLGRWVRDWIERSATPEPEGVAG